MSALLIFLNVTFAGIVLATMLALHGRAIVGGQRASRVRLRQHVRFPSVRWTRNAAPAR